MGTLPRRMLVTADAERKRLERSLHDGAQQRLVALAATLSLAQRRLEAGEEGALELIEQAGEEAKRCVEDLRDLARDIYPAVLAERGLASALNDLARRAPGPVDVLGASERRLPEAVEVTAYLVVCEALGDAREATVQLAVDGPHLVVEIRGGSLEGRQLEELGDRVGALGGRLEASSPPGERSLVRAVIPIDA